MNRSSVLNGVLWVLVAGCIAAGLVAIFSYFRLQQEAQDLRQQVQELRHESAALQASKAVTLTALTDMQSVLRQPMETPVETCDVLRRLRKTLLGLSSAQRNMLPADVFTLSANACATTPGGTESAAHKATRQFIDSYIDAASARLAGDFPQSQKLYEQTLKAEGAELVEAQWRMRALEGAAYAQMRQKNYEGARGSLATLEALRLRENAQQKLDYRFVFQGLTAIKIDCLTGSPPTDVQKSLVVLRSDFDAYRASRQDPYHRKYAALDRAFIEQDAELFDVCAAAGVKPIEIVSATG